MSSPRSCQSLEGAAVSKAEKPGPKPFLPLNERLLPKKPLNPGGKTSQNNSSLIGRLLRPIDLSSYMHTAVLLQKVIDLKLKDATHAETWSAFVGFNLALKDFISNNDLVTSLQTATDLHQSLEKYTHEFPPFSNENEISPRAYADRYLIQDSAKRLQTLLLAEMPTKPTYIVTRKGGYEIDQLIDNGIIFINENVAKELPKEAIEDINSGAKCLAFELHTASAFHMGRAIESLLLKYHKLKVKREPNSRNWGCYITELTENAGDKNTLDTITSIKNHHRNPYTHPEVTLDGPQAMAFFNVALAALTYLAIEIDKENGVGFLKKLFG